MPRQNNAKRARVDDEGCLEGSRYLKTRRGLYKKATPESTSQTSSKVQETFNIFELAEKILLDVEVRDLFVLRMVNRHFGEVIQDSKPLKRKMFLLAEEKIICCACNTKKRTIKRLQDGDEEDLVISSSSRQHREQNRHISAFLPALPNTALFSEEVPNFSKLPNFPSTHCDACNLYDRSAGNQSNLMDCRIPFDINPDASCLDMYLCQPTQEFVLGYFDWPKVGKPIRIRRDDGVRLRDAFDVVRRAAKEDLGSGVLDGKVIMTGCNFVNEEEMEKLRNYEDIRCTAGDDEPSAFDREP